MQSSADFGNTVKHNIRGKHCQRKVNKDATESLCFMGINAAGIRLKMICFNYVISVLLPAVFFHQVTKMNHKGKMQLDNYKIF